MAATRRTSVCVCVDAYRDIDTKTHTQWGPEKMNK